VVISCRRFGTTYWSHLQGLRSEYWQFLTDVSRQPIGPIFRGYAECSGNFLQTFRDNLLVPSSGATQRVVTISYRRFGRTYWYHLQGLRREYWQFFTDVSEEPIGTIFRGYAASSGNFITTFRDNLLVPYSGATQSSGNFLPTFRDNLLIPSSGATQRVVAISYRRFGRTYWYHLQGLRRVLAIYYRRFGRTDWYHLQGLRRE